MYFHIPSCRRVTSESAVRHLNAKRFTRLKALGAALNIGATAHSGYPHNEDAPFLLLGDVPRSPDLFLAKLVPADVAPAEPWQKMFHGLTSEGMSFGEVMQEYRFDVTLDALLSAEVRGTSNNGHYRITECANVSDGTAYLLGGTTAPSRLPNGSYVLVEKTSDCYS